LLDLRVGLEDRRTSGEKEALPKNLEADVRSRNQMYGPKCDRGLYFHQVVPKLLFSLFYNCFSRNRTNRKFSIDLEISDRSEFSKTCYDSGEF
jgi:hypothetical protein